MVSHLLGLVGAAVTSLTAHSTKQLVDKVGATIFHPSCADFVATIITSIRETDFYACSYASFWR